MAKIHKIPHTVQKGCNQHTGKTIYKIRTVRYSGAVVHIQLSKGRSTFVSRFCCNVSVSDLCLLLSRCKFQAIHQMSDTGRINGFVLPARRVLQVKPIQGEKTWRIIRFLSHNMNKLPVTLLMSMQFIKHSLSSSMHFVKCNSLDRIALENNPFMPQKDTIQGEHSHLAFFHPDPQRPLFPACCNTSDLSLKSMAAPSVSAAMHASGGVLVRRAGC